MHTTISTQFHSHAFIYLYMEWRARQGEWESKEREELNKEMTLRKTEDGS